MPNAVNARERVVLNVFLAERWRKVNDKGRETKMGEEFVCCEQILDVNIDCQTRGIYARREQ